MKYAKVCPKCGSNDILIFPSNPENSFSSPILTGATLFSAVPVDRYVCCSCGFVERWVRKGDIEKLRNSKKANKI